MDTNINNYTIPEIVAILKLPANSFSLAQAYTAVCHILEQLNHAEAVPNKQNLLQFFRQSFYKICTAYAFLPTDPMRQHIEQLLLMDDLAQAAMELNANFSQLVDEQLITQDEPYVGSLPVRVPDIVSVGTNQDKYVRGLVNPLKRDTIKNLLTINSKFRTDDNCTSTDFTVVLNDPYNNVVSLKLASLELMNSYYAISEYLKTNRFTVETYTVDTTTKAVTNFYSREILISEGGYSVDSLYPLLNSIFDADPQLSIIITAYNSIKGKLMFQLKPAAPPPPPGTSYAFNLIFTISEDPGRPLYYNLGWLLGFTKKKYTFATDYTTTATTINEIGFNAEMPLDFTGTKFFLIEVTDYNNNAPAVLKYNIQDKFSFNMKDILAKVPNVSSAFSVIFEDSSDRIFKTRNYFGPVRIQKLRIRLLDENGRVINLNNSDLTISFEVESIEIPYKNMLK